MADAFPTALQRTSDERWVTLDVVTRDNGRLVARVEEDPGCAAVVRWDADDAYGLHVRRLLASPPPAAGPGCHLTWPDDLLHDLDARVVGYLARRVVGRPTFPLAEFLNPASRATIAPMATRRHQLRVARNLATVVAAVHHAGHGRLRGRHFRVDDHAGVVLVRADEIAVDVAATVRHDDERRLGQVIQRLVGGRPWTRTGPLGDLLDRVGTDRPGTPASEWFHALREAERDLPERRVARRSVDSLPAATTVLTGDDLASALRRVREEGPGTGGSARTAPPTARRPIQITSRVEPGQERQRPSPHRPVPLPDADAAPAARPAAGPPRDQGTPEASPTRGSARPARAKRASRGDTLAGRAGRAAFAVASAVTLGGLASVAPFATFIAGATVLFTRAAVDTGRRKSTLGAHQTVAIAVSRLIPFATGGLALAAFVLFDLLLVLGLLMAIAERVFEYGPGFTLTWVLDLPEVPALVRWFAFTVAGAVGLSTAGSVYDRVVAPANGRRLVTAPAVALALMLAMVVADAGIVWWPLPGAG